MLGILGRTTFLTIAVLSAAAPAPAQTPSADDLAAQIRELKLSVDSLRDEVEASRREAEQLRKELQSIRGAAVPLPQAEAPESIELLDAKTSDLEQTKVESASRHHVRLSALLLFNVGVTDGALDSIDLPATAQPRAAGDSSGSLTAGVRQSRIGLEVFGPRFGGATTRADVSFDFFGGLAGTADGVSSPFARLRTAAFALDWQETSIVAGQDAPFFSPRSPSSLASTAYPALASAGNLWAWTPQVHVDRRFGAVAGSTFVVQAGLLDPLTGELPALEYNRVATAGERTRTPAEAVRVAWRRGADTTLVAAGVGAYHADQNWGFGRRVDAWAVTGDWTVPVAPKLAWSGELYRGRAIGGLGGGASVSVVFDGPPAAPGASVVPVDTMGGWTQLKIVPTSRLEFNAAVGEDAPFVSRLQRVIPAIGAEAGAVNENASGFVNAIYQARSNLLFSAEYRRLRTTQRDGIRRSAGYLTFSAGVGF